MGPQDRLPGPDGRPLPVDRDQLVRACARFLAGLTDHERALVIRAFCQICFGARSWAGDKCRCPEEGS
jgi:hypothetical protein